MRISDWSSDGCSSDLRACVRCGGRGRRGYRERRLGEGSCEPAVQHPASLFPDRGEGPGALALRGFDDVVVAACVVAVPPAAFEALGAGDDARARVTQRDGSGQQPCRARRTRRRGLRKSEEHTSELQSLMRISYAVFCLKNNNKHNTE